MKPSITVVSLGPGDPSLMTLQTADALRHARRLILRTARHRAVKWLEEQAIAFEALDGYYDRYDDFDEMHRAMAEFLWQEAAKSPVVYAVIDATSDESVGALRGILPEDGKLDVLPGVSVADRCLTALPAGVRQAGRIRILPAIDAGEASPDPTMPLLITELWNPALAGDVKLWLSDLYSDEMEIVLFPSTAQVNRKPVRVPLMELDRQKTYDHTVCAYVPAAGLEGRQRFCLSDLMTIMRVLRGPGGCPWDRQQTHQSLRKYLIEEAYEAVGAIDEDDPDHLADELGDVLLQIVFHADIARDHGDFTISDVTSAVCRKMIYRHRHVFGDEHFATPEEVSVSWEQLKKAEKGHHSQSDVLADVSQGLPALMRAAKVQKKAADVGFDWDSAEEALPKIHEEAEELMAELTAHRDPDEEMGDLLFSCVNVARLCGVEPETALKKATEKFIRRFSDMENAIISDGKALKDLTLSEMDVYWNQVKAAQSNGAAT
ncbi:MAG: nucleoside triphosphate pyrophosphohydrolase [Christensenellaceae bacterium]|nr:nucleoside triphosphate pyrophosphohydrolase [Christensenellaceae bacterium]